MASSFVRAPIREHPDSKNSVAVPLHSIVMIYSINRGSRMIECNRLGDKVRKHRLLARVWLDVEGQDSNSSELESKRQ